MLAQVHWNWEITPATIISAVWFLAIIPAYKFLTRIDSAVKQIMYWLKEYPPHLHVGSCDGTIIYPQGSAPQVSLDRNVDKKSAKRE